MLRFRPFPTDKLRMSRLTLLVAPFLLFAATDALADSKSACAKVEQVQKRIDRLTNQLNNASGNTDSITRQIDNERNNKSNAELDCKEAEDKDKRDQDECDRKIASSKQSGEAVWKWDPATKTCESLANTKSNNETGDCNNASLFKGGLKGQACKEAASTVKDVTSQNEALVASTTALTTGYSSAQAMGATGAQNDAQERQKKIMQALAISKIATGGLAMTNAARLKSAASDAEDASSSISSAQKELSARCDQLTKGSQMSMDQCFFQQARNYNIDPTEAERASFDRMRSASSQSQEQADKANNLAKAAMVQGMADALVGVQALQIANQAQQNANQAGALPSVQALAPTVLRGTSGGSMGGFGSSEGAGAPVDYGVGPGGDGGGLGGQSGGFTNSIKEGKSFGRPSGGGSGARSSVTTAGAGAAGGGGGGGGGGNKGGGKGKGSAPNNVGEYTLGGGSLGGPRAPAGGGQNDGPNPFAEALAKLFPKDASGKPVVDTRELASNDNPEIYDDAVTGNDVVAADLSLFEQVTAKYRQLTSNGRL